MEIFRVIVYECAMLSFICCGAILLLPKHSLSALKNKYRDWYIGNIVTLVLSIIGLVTYFNLYEKIDYCLFIPLIFSGIVTALFFTLLFIVRLIKNEKIKEVWNYTEKKGKVEIIAEPGKYKIAAPTEEMKEISSNSKYLLKIGEDEEEKLVLSNVNFESTDNKLAIIAVNIKDNIYVAKIISTIKKPTIGKILELGICLYGALMIATGVSYLSKYELGENLINENPYLDLLLCGVLYFIVLFLRKITSNIPKIKVINMIFTLIYILVVIAMLMVWPVIIKQFI